MIDIEKQKERLENEKKELLKELEKVSVRSDENTFDPKENIQDVNDVDDLADTAIELADFDNNHTIMTVLQDQLENVEIALEKIDDKKYGLCEVCGENISDERLTILPATKTCKEHSEV